jgi:tetratricopeptide (TPR) repeat protein
MDHALPTNSHLSEPAELLLSLCMIVRDNARTLPAALASIRPYVDEMIVVDTGSLDETPHIAEAHGARVYHFPWCDDFARARNESLSYARGRLIFWMDSDDTISPECGRQLRQLAEGQPADSNKAFVMQVHCPGSDAEGGRNVTIVDHIKLFRHHPAIRFEGRIHEQVLASIRRLEGQIEFTEIFVTHSGSDQTPAGRQRKHERDLRLIQAELTEQPDHPFHLFNLGMTLADMDRHEEAVAALRRTLEVAQPHESHVRKVYALLAGSLSRLARYPEACAVCQEGLAIFPHDNELHFRHGVSLSLAGQRHEAIAAYQAALRRAEPRHFSSSDPSLSGYKARHNLAVVHLELEQHALAELHWRIALEEQPEYLPARQGLIESLLHQRKFTAYEVQIDAWEARDSENKTAVRLAHWRLNLAIAKQEHGHLRSLIPLLKVVYPEDLEIKSTLCRYYSEQGNLAAAEQSLAELTRLNPADPAAWHNLGMTLLQAGRPQESLVAVQESLRLRPAAPQTLAVLRQLESLNCSSYTNPN